ncbi:MAG TPA: hypothetical protein VMS60_15865 [Solirubrobacterales bacterium]|nr:hypothetical protein [Solirubrobacterales bacterium]
MSEINQPPSDSTDPAEERVGSAIAAIRKRRDEIRGKGFLDLLVPGYKGNLKVRYKDLNDKEHDQLAKRYQRANERDDVEGEREAISNILIAHCERIFVRESGVEEWLLLEKGNGPLRFDRQLAEVLELAAETAVETVLEVFSPKKEGEENKRCQPDAIAPHMEAIFAWRQGQEDRISDALLGE